MLPFIRYISFLIANNEQKDTTLSSYIKYVLLYRNLTVKEFVYIFKQKHYIRLKKTCAVIVIHKKQKYMSHNMTQCIS